MNDFIKVIALAKQHNAFLYFNHSYNFWVYHPKPCENRGLELIHKF